MSKNSLSSEKILLFTSLSMLLSLVIVSSVTITYIKLIQRQIKTSSSSQPRVEVSLTAGNTGEIVTAKSGDSDNSTSAVAGQLPPVIFNTSGSVSEVESDRLIVKGDGYNFADNISRDLSVIYTSETSTFVLEAQKKVEYPGLEGLQHLKKGDKILIGGQENIRGKTEFKVKTVNVLP